MLVPLLLDVAVRERAAVLEQRVRGDKVLLVWRDALLVLDLLLHVADRVGRLDIKRKVDAVDRDNENLHGTSVGGVACVDPVGKIVGVVALGAAASLVICRVVVRAQWHDLFVDIIDVLLFVLVLSRSRRRAGVRRRGVDRQRCVNRRRRVDRQRHVVTPQQPGELDPVGAALVGAAAVVGEAAGTAHPLGACPFEIGFWAGIAARASRAAHAVVVCRARADRQNSPVVVLVRERGGTRFA